MATFKRKPDKIYADGIVTRLHRGRLVEVEVMGRICLCYLSGCLCRAQGVSVIPGDRCIVEWDASDFTVARLVWRYAS